MKRTHSLQKIFLLFVLTFSFSVMSADDKNGITISNSSGFPLVSEGVSASIVVSSSEHEVVGIAAEAFSKDVELLTGVRPDVVSVPTTSNNVLVGTIGTSEIIDQLISDGAISDTGIRGQWETFCLTTINYNGLPTLVIYGSDPRGTAYGVFELSRAMGVTPYVWWADVVPEHRDAIYVETNGRVVGPPSVKYRGMFINDEDWGLQPWAAKNMDTDVEDIGPRTYEHVFELLLRLKGNYIWPAMHPCTKAFWYYKENPVIARRYDIVLGASHCEPLLRNNVDEWQNNFQSEYGHAPGDWNWKTNSSTIRQYWTDRVIESQNNDAVYTVGMRGIHDSGMPGYSTNSEKQAALKEVITEQRNILSTNLGKDASEIPQLFCPYKEALTLYQMGLDLADDITLLWPDDNFGYIRRLSNPSEQLRSGGGGVYYHFSYWGVPYDHLWLSSVSPTLASYELRKAYDLNCRNLWVFNVGDIKPQELEFQFAMDYAWDVERWSPLQSYNYTRSWASEYFGESLADDIASVKNEYYRLAASGKPEHIHAINFSREEVEQRLSDYEQLLTQVESLRGGVPSRLQDAFFELVYYPIKSACEMNMKVLYAKMSYYAAEDGNQPAISDYGMRSLSAYESIVSLTKEYNEQIAGGKWNGIMDYAPRALSHFYEPSVQSASNVSLNPIAQDNSVNTVKIPASSYTSSGNSSDIKTINGLGISDHSVTVLPLNLTAYNLNDITSAPYVEYEVPVGIGSNTITVKCLPTFPIYSDYNLRYAISIGGSTPVFHNLKLEAETSPWSTYVVSGYSLASDVYESADEGNVTVRIYMADPGIVLSEIEVKKPASTSSVSGLVNPGFEYKSEGVPNNGAVTRGDPWGWSRTGTIVGNSYGISSDATGYEGTSICWYNSTPMPNEFELFQTLNGLPAGRYLVRCKLGVFTDQVTNQRLFANNSVQYYGKESDYSNNIVSGEDYTFAGHAFGVKNGSKGQLYEMAVYVTISEGEPLKVGIRSSNLLSNGSRATTNAGWFKVDDFRIDHADEEVSPEVILYDDTYTSLLVNPSFELTSATNQYESGTYRGDPYGWSRSGTLSGNSWGINADGTGIEGKALCWYNANSGTFPNAFQLYQTVQGLPSGHYQLSAKLACFTDKLTNQRIFANKYATYYGRETDYALNLADDELPTWGDNTPTSASMLKPLTLDFWVFPDEDVTLGVRSSNQLYDGSRTSGTENAGWFKVDDFRITQVSTEKDDFVSHVSTLVSQAETMLPLEMSIDVRSSLSSSKSDGESINMSSDMETIRTATNNLIDALAQARKSIHIYKQVRALVESADSRVSTLDSSYDVMNYESVLAPIRNALNSGALDTSADYASSIHNALVSAIKSQTNAGADMTDALESNTHSMTGWSTTGGDKWQLNTWSTEGKSDGTNMLTPFIEDWVNSNTSTPLKNATLTTTVNGLHAGVYQITALVRTYREYSGSGNLEGAYMFANDQQVSVTDGYTCVYGDKTGVFNTYEVEVTLTEEGSISYGIMIENANFNWLAVKNFTLTYVGAVEKVTISSSQYTTYVTQHAIDFSKTSGIQAFKVTSTDPCIQLDAVTSAPAGTAVVLKSVEALSNPTTFYLIETENAGDDFTDNLLLASTGEGVTANSSDGAYFALADKSKGVGFYRVSDGVVIPSGKGYLLESAGSVKDFIGFDVIPTSIDALDVARKSDVTYDISGRPVHNPQKGMYIVNGKKVLIP